MKNVDKLHLSWFVGPNNRSCSSVSTRWSLGMFVKSRSDWYSLDWSGAEH